MQSPANVLILLLGSILLAFFSTLIYTKLAQRAKSRQAPAIGSILRIRANSGIYRGHLLGISKSGWTISAPLQRDHFVPLRVGERITIEAAGSGGVSIFRTSIVSRQIATHDLTIEAPLKIYRMDRREHDRHPQPSGVLATVEGEIAQVIDLSSGGVKVRTSLKTHAGDRLRLNLPSGEEVYGWVLCLDGNEARIRFEELIDVGRHREAAPAF